MDATLHALGAILLRAVPTFLLLVLLHFYLKGMFFKPLERVLKNRYEATEGARQLAAKSMELAAAKTTEYENAMRAARGEVYQAHDRLHKKLQEEQAAAVREARAKVEAKVNEVKNQLAADVERTKADLLPESDRLAAQIADAVLRRSTA